MSAEKLVKDVRDSDNVFKICSTQLAPIRRKRAAATDEEISNNSGNLIIDDSDSEIEIQPTQSLPKRGKETSKEIKKQTISIPPKLVSEMVVELNMSTSKYLIAGYLPEGGNKFHEIFVLWDPKYNIRMEITADELKIMQTAKSFPIKLSPNKELYQIQPHLFLLLQNPTETYRGTTMWIGDVSLKQLTWIIDYVTQIYNMKSCIKMANELRENVVALAYNNDFNFEMTLEGFKNIINIKKLVTSKLLFEFIIKYPNIYYDEYCKIVEQVANTNRYP